MNYREVQGGQLSVILLRPALFGMEVRLRNGGLTGLVSLISILKGIFYE